MHIDVNGARLYFDVVGSQLAIDGERMVPRPTLLVLHGGPGFDHSGMRPYFDRFADSHQVIYLDHRGNGRSGGDPADWNLAQWGDDIAGFCAALGIERPAVYGLSFGGMVAMSYAARHPGLPSKLVFSSTAGRMDLTATYAMMERLGGPEARRIAEDFWTNPTEARAGAYIETCMPLYTPGETRDGGDRKRAILRTEVMFHFIEGEQRTMDLLPGLAAVRCPTLVLAGAHDPITPLACAAAIHAALPAGVGELVVFDDAGHGVHRAQPERAEAVLRRFLA
ncbi:MAG TPA: alpha/beta hydrolase [Caulobacteraceae bacterium]|jgi:proline iminopeptidase|nr:alpha/beta hydrolase [Caulobacteraceae bacterium]